MKLSFLLSVVVLAHKATAGGGVPGLQWDPDTVKDRIEWYDNDLG